MKRSQFLAALGQIGLAGALPAATFHARRGKTEYTHELAASPEVVFPLLCPVREYEWLEGWTADMVYSESGVAEQDCVFRTNRPPAGPAVWCVNCYEPPARIEFVIVAAGTVSRLGINLERTTSGGTRIRWERMFTGLTEEGNARATSWNVDVDRALCEKIEYFTRNGKMLRAGAL